MTRLKKAQRTHQNSGSHISLRLRIFAFLLILSIGAIALARHEGLRRFHSDIAKHLLLYIGHVEVSSAIREHRRVPDDVTIWWEVVNMHRNASSELDRLGVLVAATQYDFEQLILHQANCTDPACTHAQNLIEVTNQALAVEGHLIAWSATVPDWWRLVKLASVGQGQPPVATYSGICEIYPSIQIASICNHYRSYRLVILELLVRSSKLFPGT